MRSARRKTLHSEDVRTEADTGAVLPRYQNQRKTKVLQAYQTQGNNPSLAKRRRVYLEDSRKYTCGVGRGSLERSSGRLHPQAQINVLPIGFAGLALLSATAV